MRSFLTGNNRRRSCPRELLDHVIPRNEGHLRRLVQEYVAYFQQDRIHDALGKDTPRWQEHHTPSQSNLAQSARSNPTAFQMVSFQHGLASKHEGG